MFDLKENHEVLFDEEHLEFISNIPKKMVPLVSHFLTEATMYEDEFLLDMVRDYMKVVTSEEGHQTSQLVEAMKTNDPELLREDEAILGGETENGQESGDKQPEEADESNAVRNLFTGGGLNEE